MEHLLPWLTLKSVPGIGNLLFRRLVTRFNSPQAVLDAPLEALAQVEGMSARLGKAIQRQKTPPWAHREIDTLQKKGFSLITQHDPVYPALLLQIPDPPPMLYVCGQLAPLFSPIAVVGARKATSYGLTTTRRLCEGLAASGATIVSGMARGIDTAAHWGAIAGGGRTVAVLGSGLDCVYPVENLKLYHQIAENGAVITEFALEVKPAAHHFPMRNRIISGMSLGTLVVEAARRSGSLITARLAAEQGREVFAVPGSIHAANTQGTHALIQQGAKLVRCKEDILEELGPQIEGLAAPRSDGPACGPVPVMPLLAPEEQQVFESLGPYPVHIDDLARHMHMQMDIACLTSILLQLELKGLVCQEPGKYFLRHADFTKA